jgi:[glutamine synthetase] adenylyltransferase / [glutamine synthetase]-adenylyl-L-tyrosine phosphorylase
VSAEHSLDAGVELVSLAHRIDGERATELATRIDGARHPRALLLATAYPALAPGLERAPEALPEPAAHTREELARQLGRELAACEPDARREALRAFAARERLRIALRELLPPALGGVDLEESAAELSDLADVTIDAALAEACDVVFARTGAPRDGAGGASELTVLGMGKLGGRELNAGSDVDLICFYDSDDAAGNELSAHDIWTRVVKRMTASLEEPGDNGFVWRVDLRLRPEGSRGPLVNSLAAAERYYESFGRLWERAALLRARPVAGSLALGERLLEALAPFVWQRRVDPNIAVAMYELVHQARAELSSAPERDLKLGRGGIREAEFFIQALQLIWGGREPRLRERSTLAAANRLRAAGLVSGREADDLAAAYVALRRAEHAVQWSTGVQTHSLPREAAALERVARSLGFGDGESFVADLGARQERVSALLTGILPGGEPEVSRWHDALLALDRDDFDAFRKRLQDAGLAEDEHGQLARDLFETARLDPDGPLGARTRERWRHLAASIFDAVADAADPTQAARFLRGFAMRLRPPGVYSRLLADEPAAVRRLITVLGGSAFVGELVQSRPELADLLLFEHRVPRPDDAREEVRRAWEAGRGADLEDAVGHIRRAQTRLLAGLALSDLGGEIETRDATQVMSALADAVLEVSARIALGADEVKGLAILAMGKLGGGEIGYGSDLDVIFLFDPSAAPSDDGVGYFTKMARRIIQMVSMPHPEGAGYDLDTRLRPSGSQGMLVVSLPAFARYHGGEASESGPNRSSEASSRGAATWERLALLRARFAAGDAALGAEAMRIAERAAYEAPLGDVAQVARDVHALRLRMERELARERPGRYDLKLGRGGLIDIEFAVQLLQLAHGAHVEVRTTETARAIAALERIGALAPAHAETLAEGLRYLRRLEQRLRIVHGDSAHLIEERAAGLLPLARRMGIRDADGARARARLVERYRAIADRVRAAYEAIVVAPYA